MRVASILAEKYLKKDRKLFAAFMDSEKAFDRVDEKGLWDTLRVYGEGGQLLERISLRSFLENANASVQVNRELSESFNVEVGVRQGCVMSPWLFNIYMDGCTDVPRRSRPHRSRIRVYAGRLFATPPRPTQMKIMKIRVNAVCSPFVLPSSPLLSLPLLLISPPLSLPR